MKKHAILFILTAVLTSCSSLLTPENNDVSLQGKINAAIFLYLNNSLSPRDRIMRADILHAKVSVVLETIEGDPKAKAYDLIDKFIASIDWRQISSHQAFAVTASLVAVRDELARHEVNEQRVYRIKEILEGILITTDALKRF